MIWLKLRFVYLLFWHVWILIWTLCGLAALVFREINSSFIFCLAFWFTNYGKWMEQQLVFLVTISGIRYLEILDFVQTTSILSLLWSPFLHFWSTSMRLLKKAVCCVLTGFVSVKFEMQSFDFRGLIYSGPGSCSCFNASLWGFWIS